jgi:DNA ligase-1
VKRLLVDARGEEIRYLTRTFIQHLRIGAVKTTMLIALARAFTFSRPSDATWECPGIPPGKGARQELFARNEEALKQCFARRPNYNDLVPALLRGGIDALEKECAMEIHIPLKPMLGSITRDLEEMLVKLQGRDFACEYKYDGQRAQIHCDDAGNVSIFSRHLELMTSKYPDLVELVPKIRMEDVKSFILEGEVVAVNTTTGELKPFQSLAGRERKNVDIANISVTVCLFAFDLMYINGQQLLSRPFRERRHLLRTKFREIPNHFTWVTSLDATSTGSAVVREFFKSSLTVKCEGIMVKILDNIPIPAHLTPAEEGPSTSRQKSKSSRRKPLLSTYEPDKRLESWLKVKKDYSSTTDTLDLIPIGGWHGQGRKSAWWSPVLLAVRNPDTGSLEAVCKCISGFTDKFYAEMKTFYNEDGENTSKIKKGYYESALNPTVWFEAREVWEVAFADITLSPTYTAALGLVSDERGLSLRFPRFVRKREDKGIEEASTSEFLAGE